MTHRRPPPIVPRPDLIRRPTGAYGWLDVRLLSEEHLRDLGPDASAVLLFLALVADRRGASWWSRARMATSLGMCLDEVDRALRRLQDHDLLAHRPWRDRDRDGVWQLLPLSEPPPPQNRGELESLRDILDRADPATRSRSPPDSRAS